MTPRRIGPLTDFFRAWPARPSLALIATPRHVSAAFTDTLAAREGRSVPAMIIDAAQALFGSTPVRARARAID